MKKILIVNILLSLLLANILWGKKQVNYIAKIELYKGKVYYSTKISKKAVKVKIGQKLIENTVITTSQKSSVTIKLMNSSLIELKENSRIVLNKELLEKSSASLLQGSAKFKMAKIIKKDAEFNVYTPTAVVGVRGTEYELGVAPDGSLAINMDEGEVVLKNDKDQTTLKKDESAMASLEGEPITKKEESIDIDNLNKTKQEEIKKNPLDKLNTINDTLNNTLDKQQQLIEKLDTTTNPSNKNLNQDIDQGLFNEAKTEGLYQVAKDIKDDNRKDKLVKDVYAKINNLYTRLTRLNKLMDEKFNNLDKIYESKANELQNKLDEKEKMFDEKFKKLYEEDGSEK